MPPGWQPPRQGPCTARYSGPHSGAMTHCSGSTFLSHRMMECVTAPFACTTLVVFRFGAVAPSLQARQEEPLRPQGGICLSDNLLSHCPQKEPP